MDKLLEALRGLREDVQAMTREFRRHNDREDERDAQDHDEVQEVDDLEDAEDVTKLRQRLDNRAKRQAHGARDGIRRASE